MPDATPAPAVPLPDPVPAAAASLEAIAAGDLTASELLNRVLARVAAVDSAGARVRAVLALDPSAPEQAAALDAGSGERGPLHGLAVMVKDNIDVAGMVTSAGSLTLAGNVAAADAPVAARLRAAGAVIAGKTNLSEWANFRSTRSSSGWSGAGGLTRNPHVLDRSAGGSSSGSGAAVGAGIVAVALGTETDGSILCPAALNGVVGVKPTVGLTPRTGVVPISASQDTVGPLARTVLDAALVLDVIAGPDEDDPATHAAPPAVPGQYAAAARRGACDVSGLRLGVVSGNTWDRHELLDASCRAALAGLAEAGVALVEGVDLSAPDSLAGEEFTILLHEFVAGVDAYLAPRAAAAGPGGGIPASLAEVQGRNRELGETELGWFGQELIDQALEVTGSEPGRQAFAAALAHAKSAACEVIDAALTAAGVDALVAPTYPPAWQTDLVNGDRGSLYSMSHLPAVAGYPAVTIPVGLVHGLPVGIAVFGTAWSEPVLLRIAAGIETAVAAGGAGVPLGRFVPAVSPDL